MTKSVIDVAQNIASNVPNAVNGGIGGVYPGANLTISRSKVQIIRQLSEGGFGTVYLTKNEAGNRSYALKQLLCQNKEQIEEAHKEIDILLLCKDNAFVVQLLDHSSTQINSGGGGNSNSNSLRQVLLLFPLYPRGTAWDEVERAGLNLEGNPSSLPPWPFPEEKAIHIIYCIASALDFLHEQGYSHRDVKPHNILLSEEEDRKGCPHAVLMDFGSCTQSEISIKNRSDALKLEDEASIKTSAAYRSPELTSPPLPPFVVDERVDTWGLGCTMYCLAFGRSPFETPKEGVLRLAIMNAKYSFPSDQTNRTCRFSNDFCDLIDKMLHSEITKRPFMKEIINDCLQWKQ
jgi:serine/threonine kinase 16